MMKNITFYLVLLAITLLVGSGNCVGDGPEINYEYGTFPDSALAISGINSEFDDFNAAIPQIGGTLPIMFSSNRSSQGGEFDIVTGVVSFVFNQVNGEFLVEGIMYSSIFYTSLESKVNTPTDQLGPYRFFNSKNGMEFFFVATENVSGDLDLMFLEYIPPTPGESPYLYDPQLVTRLNSSFDDAYLSIDWDIANVYLTSDRGGDFDIYTSAIDEPSALKNWLIASPATLLVADSVNSISDDKCPFIFDNYMIFASDRSGGMGGFDLYYSKFVDGKWGSPVNFGPGVNTQYNEYRPVVGFAPGYTNEFMIFSSDRPGGMGNYDLYLTGVTLE